MVRTPVMRLSFVNFETPKETEQDDGTKRKAYGCAALGEPGQDLSLLNMCCERFGKAELGDKYNRLKRKTPLREQDEKVDDYDGFQEGAYFLNVTTKYKPRCTGRNKEEISNDSFYSGCYARLTLRPYFYDVRGNKGIGLGIAAAQFIRDGEPLGGGGIDPNDAFDEEEGDEIEDDESLSSDDEDEDNKPARRSGGKGKNAFL
jgi:hypothetical protein